MAHQVTAATLSIPPVTTRAVQIFAPCLEFDQALTGGPCVRSTVEAERWQCATACPRGICDPIRPGSPKSKASWRDVFAARPHVHNRRPDNRLPQRVESAATRVAALGPETSMHSSFQEEEGRLDQSLPIGKAPGQCFRRDLFPWHASHAARRASRPSR